MPIVSSDIPRLIELGMKTVFLEEIKNLSPSYDKICTTVPVGQESVSYGWIGKPPAIREFIDERVGKGSAQYGMSIKDKTWEATISVSRRAIENDQYGAIMMQVRQLAQSMVQGVNKRAWEALREANSATGAARHGRSFDNYDKNGDLISGSTIYYASASHVYPDPAEYKGTQSNCITTATNALSSSSLWHNYGDMTTFLDDRGEIIGDNTPNLLIVPPKLAETATQLLTAGAMVVPSAAMGYVNTVPKLGLELEICPYWVADVANNTQNWALAKTNGVVKPLILQLFTPAANGQLFEFSALEGSSDNGFMRDQFYYGIRGRWEIGYGDWRSFNLAITA